VETRDNPAKNEMIIKKNLVGSQDFDGLRSEEQRPWPSIHPISLRLGLLKNGLALNYSHLLRCLGGMKMDC
jgi:hypothetical protein